MNFNRIVCIAAHPDDIELGMGGTVSKYKKQNKEVFFIINYIPKDNYTTGSYEERIIELKNSLNIFNIPHDNLIINNFYNKNIREKVALLDNNLKIIKPDAIFTHYEHDIHQEHNDVFKIVSISCRNKPISLFMWENNVIGGLLKNKFNPNYFIKLSKENIDDKINSWKCHKTQYNKYKLLDNLIISQSNLWGYYYNAEYVEAFMNIKFFN